MSYRISRQIKSDAILRKDNASLKISFLLLFKEPSFSLYMSGSEVYSTDLATKTLHHGPLPTPTSLLSGMLERKDAKSPADG